MQRSNTIYAKASAAALGTATLGGALAFTGFHDLWMAVAAFVLIGAGTAIVRIIPKRR